MSVEKDFKVVEFHDIAEDYGFVQSSVDDYLWVRTDDAQAFHEANPHLYVYTLVSGEGCTAYIENGWRWANRLAYLFSEKHLDTTYTFCKL